MYSDIIIKGQTVTAAETTVTCIHRNPALESSDDHRMLCPQSLQSAMHTLVATMACCTVWVKLASCRPNG